MKISRRSVLHISGLAAAALALTGCSAAGSAALGGKLPGLLKGLAKKGETAASSEAASDMAVTPPPEGEPLVPALPEYDADILTGAERSTNSRPVAVMVNNIANSQRQNARPQRGIGSADLLIEAKVEGGITRLCAVFSDADSIPEVGPIRSGRDQFLQLLMPWNILYYHDGESIFCTQFVNVYGYSGLNIGGKNYFKTPIHPFVSHRNNRGRDVATSTPSSPPARRSAKPLLMPASASTLPARGRSSTSPTTAPTRSTSSRVNPRPKKSPSYIQRATAPRSATPHSATPTRCRCTTPPRRPLRTPSMS